MDERISQPALPGKTDESRLIPIPNALLAEHEWRVESGQICSFLAVEKCVEGLLVLEDVPCAEISRLSPDLRAEWIKESILLTGDGEVVAQQIGKIAQVDRVISRCLPEDKVRTVKELEELGHRDLMVGDGINDALVLPSATVGMAIGTRGLPAAASAAVLLSTDILRVVHAVRLGMQCAGFKEPWGYPWAGGTEQGNSRIT